VPATTALRWISALEREGLIQKRSDPLDGRRAYVSLSTKGLNAMFAYFRAAAFESVPSDSRLECCCQHCRARCRAEPK
jgi:DNA-binding MarR family transcriptional regulator